MRKFALFTLILLIATGPSFAETHIPGGEVSGVWNSTGSPYFIEGEIHVPTDSMLRIMLGCSIIFQGHFKFCVDNNALLKAIGTETDSIVFTAIDTNLTDSSGGHHGIRFLTAADGCSLMYCKIEYGNAIGDYRDNTGGGIFSRNTDLLTILNSTIVRNNAEDGG